MSRTQAHHSISKTSYILLVLLCSLAISACGGSSADAVADASSVETGKTISNDNWQAELTKPTEQAKIIGEGNLVYQSESGTYLIVFVQVKNNSGTLQVVPRDLFKLMDGAGNEHKASKSAIQVAYVQHKGKDQGLDIVLDSPMQDGASREGVLVFEVPADASGLKLVIKDTDETLEIGF